MKKSGLQDMKKQNRRVLLQTVLEHESLSRIEIANLTELSPSTVSGLVSELLEEGLLVESGVRVATGGRSRTALTVNRDRGVVAVAEIGRKSSRLILFDLALQVKQSVVLAEQYLSSNELLTEITRVLFNLLGHEAIRQGALMGIGLLFQKDMRPSDFNVVYSTGFSSASITLVEALRTQFRVPVLEEYSQNYTAAQAMRGMKEEKVNSAHIAVGAAVVASVNIDGRPIPLKNGVIADMTPLMTPETQLELKSGESGEEATSLNREQPGLLARQIGAMTAILCTLFNLDVVFLSGTAAHTQGFLSTVEGYVKTALQADDAPRFELLRKNDGDTIKLFADTVRQKALCAR